MIMVLMGQVFLTVLFDVFLLSSLPISLDLGINGVAYSNILSGVILFLLLITLLKNDGVTVFSKKKVHFHWFFELKKISIMSGIETLVRNLAFMLMIVRLINMVGEQGTYWISNGFIWSWLLVPILQLGEIIKREFSHDTSNIKKKITSYLWITTAIVLVWFMTMPWWEPFFETVLQLENHQSIISLTLISVPFYIIFAYNHVFDSFFYAVGRTDLMLLQSLLVNIFYYGSLYILYLIGWYQPTLISIALMFGGGILIDSVITMVLFMRYLKKNDKKILKASLRT